MVKSSRFPTPFVMGLVLVCLFGGSCLVAAAGGSADILVENLVDSERVGYQLLLIRGAVGRETDSLEVSAGADRRTWPVVDRCFKALVMLKRGRNEIHLAAPGHRTRPLIVNYDPIKSSRFVRMVYVIAADSDGRFQTPPGEPDDIESARKRIAFTGLLMQTATAEVMNDAGYGRKTFRLYRNGAGDVETVAYRSKLKMAQAQKMTGLQLWQKLYRDLGASNGKRRNVAVMQMTRYNPQDGMAYAHTALGAGGLALFGSGGLHTWAQGLDELVECFSDQRRVTDFSLFDDSAYRRTFWANYTTGIGVCMHELGHTFGLNHSGDREGIMERGFDRINRLFVMSDGSRVLDDYNVRWSSESARLLNQGPWLN